MAKGNLVISCGGAGKGVLNFIKAALLERHGSLAAAGTVLLSIDGPPPERDGMYTLPDGSSLSSVEGANEFFGLSRDPKPILKAISEGGQSADAALPFIAQHVTREEAFRLLQQVPSMNPASGMGGCRPIGHANLCMEAPDLVHRITTALNTARPMVQTITDAQGQNINALNVFVVGCQFGGTGAGQLLDVAQLVRSRLAAGERLILTLFLPDAFDRVIPAGTDGRMYADAKAYCGLREIARMRKSLGIMDQIEYAANVAAPYGHLFDLCMLVDGVATGVDLSNQRPMNGVVPAIGDAITSLIEDDQHTPTQYIDWISRPLVRRHYSAVGSHVWRFPAARLTRDYALRFAQTVYQRILLDGEAPERAKKRADSLMNSTLFTQLATDVRENRNLPTSPPEWRALRPRLTINLDPPEWPQSPGQEVRYLPKEVRMAGFVGLFGPSNAEVKQDADEQLLQYIGKPDDAYETTVYGWLNTNSFLLRRTFADEFISLIRNLFYESDDHGAYAPRPLSQEPNTIVQAMHFLATTLELLSNLKEVLEQDIRDKGSVSDPESPGQRISIATLARRQVDEIGSRMGSGRDRSLQEQYVQASQVYLEARVWETIMGGAVELAKDLVELVKVGWGWVGDSASGWVTFLRDVCLKSIEAQRTENRSIATQEDEIVARTSYPRVGSAAERALFDDVVSQLDLTTSALDQLSWELTEVAPTGDPKQDLAGRMLLLRTNIEVPPQMGGQLVIAKDLISGQARQTQLTYHTPEQLRAYGAQGIGPRIGALTIWDALNYVYLNGWLSNRHPGAQPTDDTLNEFVVDRVARLSARAGCLFRTAQDAAETSSFCFSHFVADQTPVGQLAAAFRERLQAALDGVNELGALSQELRVISFAHGVDHGQWAYMPTAQGQYYTHEKRAELPTVNIYPNEKYSYLLEQIITQDVRHRPISPLPPEITCLMNNPDDLELFVLAFLDGRFDELDDPDEPNSMPNLGVTHPRSIVLGKKKQFTDLARSFLDRTGARSIDAAAARTEIANRVKGRLAGCNDEQAKRTFFKTLFDKAMSPDVFNAPATELDAGVPWDEWRDVFAAIVIRRAKKYDIAIST